MGYGVSTLFETHFLLALVLSWAIEVPVLVALLRFVFRNRTLSVPRIIAAGLLCTALTLPYLWFVLPPFVDAAYYLPAGECLVVLVEAAVLYWTLGLDIKKAGACSLVMNAASFFLGLVLMHVVL